MKKDQFKINKFLELVPDDSIKRTFRSLSASKIIRRNDIYTMDNYLEYIRDYNLVFENEILNTNHKNFHKSFNELDGFLLANFFPIDSQPDFFQLYDSSFIEENEEKYLKFEKELETIISDVENKYVLLRKAIEEYTLEYNIEINTINTENKTESKINKFPHKLPRGTKWENFIFKFIDKEKVLIKVKQFEYTTNYKEMGFLGRGKDPIPSEGWNFLIVLSKLMGELSIKDPEARDKYKKQKEILSRILEEYFSIDYDPFYPYDEYIKDRKEKNSYKIKIFLIPFVEKQENNLTLNEGNDDLGITEYINEQCPSVQEDQYK